MHSLFVARLVILDVDGTLVDTNYQHALAWFRAFREHGQVLPLWRIHRATGMGGDKMVEYLGGRSSSGARGDAIRDAESHAYSELIGEVEPLDGAREFLIDLKDLGLTVVLASSAKEDELDHYLDLLEARDVVDAWTSSADVHETKRPRHVQAAISKAGGGPYRRRHARIEAARRPGISRTARQPGASRGRNSSTALADLPRSGGPALGSADSSTRSERNP